MNKYILCIGKAFPSSRYTVGKIYKIIRETDTGYVFLGDHNHSYEGFKRYFKEIKLNKLGLLLNEQEKNS